MANYHEARVKLTNAQLTKLKPAAKSKNGTAIRITKKMFQDEELSHELFLTVRERTKIRNGLIKNISMEHNCLKSFNQKDFLVKC